MADDDIPDEEELDEEVPDEDDEEFAEDDELDEVFDLEDDIAVADDSDDDDDDDDDDVVTPARPTTDDDDEEDDDDVEADLDAILKDRIAAGDDEDEDEEEEEKPKQAPAPIGDITPKRSDEWTCEQCFFIVSRSQFGPKDNPRCPQGEEPCPSIARAFR